MSKPKTVTVNVSGPHKAGKTCIARLIRRHLQQLGVTVEIHDPHDRPTWTRLMKAFRPIAAGTRVVVSTTSAKRAKRADKA